MRLAFVLIGLWLALTIGAGAACAVIGMPSIVASLVGMAIGGVAAIALFSVYMIRNYPT